jgi:hypothetical protein
MKLRCRVNRVGLGPRVRSVGQGPPYEALVKVPSLPFGRVPYYIFVGRR